MISTEQIQRAKDISAKATAGPWACVGVVTEGFCGVGMRTSFDFTSYQVVAGEKKALFDASYSTAAEIREVPSEDGVDAWDEAGRNNLTFAAEARTLLPAAAEEVERLWAENAELRADLKRQSLAMQDMATVIVSRDATIERKSEAMAGADKTAADLMEKHAGQLLEIMQLKESLANNQSIREEREKEIERLRVEDKKPRNSVMAFARAMELTLRKHDVKKGGQSNWRKDNDIDLIHHAMDEVGELLGAWQGNEGNERIAAESVDLANMAMMVWDRSLMRDDAVDGVTHSSSQAVELPERKSSEQYSYSTDGEMYNGHFDSIAAACHEATNGAEVGQTFWVGLNVSPPPPESYWRTGDWIEQISCSEEYSGDWAYGWDASTKEQEAELEREVQAVLASWLDRHNLRPTFFNIEALREKYFVAAPGEWKALSAMQDNGGKGGGE